MIAVLMVSIVLAVFAYRQRLQRMRVAAALNDALAAHQRLMQELEAADAEIDLAESDLKLAEDRVESVEQELKKGYLVMIDLSADRNGLQKARLALARARAKRRLVLGSRQHKDLKALEKEIEKLRAQLDVMGVSSNPPSGQPGFTFAAP